MARITDRNDWFELWVEDKNSIIETMVRNMTADIEAGHSYFGDSIKKQRRDLENYKRQMDEEIDRFKVMEEKEVNRWCYYDMVKRGAI